MESQRHELNKGLGGSEHDDENGSRFDQASRGFGRTDE
jgi:hypothetical protein